MGGKYQGHRDKAAQAQMPDMELQDLNVSLAWFWSFFDPIPPFFAPIPQL
jgi:hypothetical protein